jgi:hypothetical protein
LKRKSIALCSIGITLLILSTHTTIGLVEKNYIEEDITEKIDSLDIDIVYQVFNTLVDDESSCDCEQEEGENPLICGLLLVLFAIPYTIYLVLLYLFYGSVFIMAVLQIFLAIFGIPFLRLAEAIGCGWTEEYPSQILSEFTSQNLVVSSYIHHRTTLNALGNY